MYLLHDSVPLKIYKIIFMILASLPTSCIISIALSKNSDQLTSFPIACLRMLKLLRWGEIRRYFNLFDLKKRLK